MAGFANFDDDGVFSEANFDDSSFGISAIGGYKFMKYLAVEGRVSTLGSYHVGSEDLNVGAISGHVVGIIPFGASGWELFGQLGLGALNLDADCCGTESNFAASAGIGVRFYPIERLGISLQTDAYAYEEDDFERDRDFAIGVTQLGVHYIF
jgi:hypothetical protein